MRWCPIHRSTTCLTRIRRTTLGPGPLASQWEVVSICSLNLRVQGHGGGPKSQTDALPGCGVGGTTSMGGSDGDGSGNDLSMPDKWQRFADDNDA